MLSKSMGQILRISAAMHVRFHMNDEVPLPDVITEEAINVSIDFVEVCCQHAAYLTGRRDLNQEFELLKSGNFSN